MQTAETPPTENGSTTISKIVTYIYREKTFWQTRTEMASAYLGLGKNPGG
jgi:hypothetical protein